MSTESSRQLPGLVDEILRMRGRLAAMTVGQGLY
jgi:hypothetical protein